MTDPKAPENYSNEKDEQEITQNKPSHMNQGNQTFVPDKQRSQSAGKHRENQKSGQQEEHSRKAS